MRGLPTVAPVPGLATLMGEPGAGVSGGLVVEVVEAPDPGAPLVLVVDWAVTPAVVVVVEEEVVGAPVRWAAVVPELQAPRARPSRAAAAALLAHRRSEGGDEERKGMP
ncbi:MAG: hypothetical protein ACYCS2_05135 [Acidimicrobiales bacterium]